METDIILVFIKHLIQSDIIDIDYLDSIPKDRFINSNLHKIVASLCINHVNLKSNINNNKLRMDINMYRNTLVHCEGSINKDKIKYCITTILKDILNLQDICEYSEYDYMIY